jgi:16S rRNA (uracil1498-N3)-methyltransferase
MAQERRRLLIDPQRLQAAGDDGQLALLPEESRYLTRVLRLGPGGSFVICDGAGNLWEARIEASTQARLEQPLASPLQRQLRPSPELVLAAAVVKRDYELVVRMAVELGVDRLQPWICERTAVMGQLRPERWRAIAREAAEQCERLWLPQLAEPGRAHNAWPAASGLRLLATTRRQGLPALEEVLEQVDQPPDAVWLACGPEGGWSEAEEAAAEAHGWIPVSLGPRILRASTAAVAGISGLSAWRHRRWSC